MEMQPINTATGELFLIPDREPPFIKMYIDDLANLTHIQKGPRGLLYELAKRIDFDGYISLNKIIRKKIAERLSLQPATLSNYLVELKRKSLLIEECRNVFILNPQYFARGDWTKICKNREKFNSLVLSITYSASGSRTITGMVQIQ